MPGHASYARLRWRQKSVLPKPSQEMRAAPCPFAVPALGPRGASAFGHLCKRPFACAISNCINDPRATEMGPADVACRSRPKFPVQCGTAAPFRSQLRRTMTAPRQEHPPSARALRGLTPTARRDPVFRSNGVLFQSNKVVSGPIRTRELIEADRCPFRHEAHATVIQGERPQNRGLPGRLIGYALATRGSPAAPPSDRASAPP